MDNCLVLIILLFMSDKLKKSNVRIFFRVVHAFHETSKYFRKITEISTAEIEKNKSILFNQSSIATNSTQRVQQIHHDS